MNRETFSRCSSQASSSAIIFHLPGASSYWITTSASFSYGILFRTSSIQPPERSMSSIQTEALRVRHSMTSDPSSQRTLFLLALIIFINGHKPIFQSQAISWLSNITLCGTVTAARNKILHLHRSIATPLHIRNDRQVLNQDKQPQISTFHDIYRQVLHEITNQLEMIIKEPSNNFTISTLRNCKAKTTTAHLSPKVKSKFFL